MTVRADVAELLRAGYGDRTIARQLGDVTISSVTRARTLLRIPKARGGNKAAASAEDLFWRRIKPVDGGHMEWAGNRSSRGTPVIHWQRTTLSAYRIAYRIRHGHDPQGYGHTACDHEGCVAPEHVADSATTPRRGHHHHGGCRPNGDRADIVRLLHEGLSNKAIGARIHTDPMRVARIRAEEGLPKTPPAPPATFEDAWAAATEPTDDGHLRWIGTHRDTQPQIRANGRTVSARRAAFEHLHGRPAKGPVWPGCGWGPCVKPEHLEDRPMRDQLANQLASIFGETA